MEIKYPFYKFIIIWLYIMCILNNSVAPNAKFNGKKSELKRAIEK
jgi:hypothetical protein